MSVEPVSYRLNTLIAESDGAINEARTAFEPYVKANRAIPKPMITRYYNMLMHRHALELQRTYPQAVVLTHIQFVSIMSPEGAELPAKATLVERAINASFSSIGVFQELIKGVCVEAGVTLPNPMSEY